MTHDFFKTPARAIPLLLSGGILFFLLLSRAEWRPLEAGATLDFEVSAACEPHAEADSLREVRIRFSYVSRPEGLDFQAGLSVDGSPFVGAEQYRFGLPERGWVSVIFPGPVYRVRHFCDASIARRHLHLSYAPHREVWLSAGESNDFSARELPTAASEGRPLFPIDPEGEYGNLYEAGGARHPYWLQVAVPVHSRQTIGTTLTYSLQ